MLSKFFIHRPKFALVISLAMTLMGMIALKVLPISEYPQISPTVITVSTMYPGANADVVKKTVAQPIEAKVNGVEDMIYMSSVIGNDGSYTLRIYFRVGADGDMAQVRVNNLVAQATSSLPQEVNQIGVTVKKKSSDMLGVITLRSPKQSHDSIYLSNYADLNIVERLKRIEGMSDITLLGKKDYSMRIWLNPNKLATQYKLNEKMMWNAGFAFDTSMYESQSNGDITVPTGKAYRIGTGIDYKLDSENSIGFAFEAILMESSETPRFQAGFDEPALYFMSMSYNWKN